MNLKPHHTAISVRNLDASLLFYQALGFQQVHRYDEPDDSMTLVHLKLGTSFLEIFYYPKNARKSSVDYSYANNLDDIGVKHIALRTTDIEGTLQDLRSKGLADETTQIEASETSKAWWFFIKDPDGVWVEIIKEERYD